jgi:hypothetical protein
MTAIADTKATVDELRGSFTGELVQPGDRTYRRAPQGLDGSHRSITGADRALPRRRRRHRGDPVRP